MANPDGDRYLNALSQMNHNIADNVVGDAVDVYKEILAAQPDNSVVILSVGFLNNLYDLLEDPDGAALAASKGSKRRRRGGRLGRLSK